MDYSEVRDGISTLFDLINNKLLVTRILELEKSINKSSANYISKSIFRNALCALYNLSYLEGRYPEVWRNASAFNTLLVVAKFAEMHPSLSNFQMVAYLTIANVYQDIQVADNLPELKLLIGFIMDVFVKCCRNLSSKLLYLKMNVYDDDPTLYEVTFTEEYDTKWNLIELANAIFKLAVNDSLKQVIYFDTPIKSCLREAIIKGFEVCKTTYFKLESS
jgi:hypothetical protein